jgi:hydrogenase-4 component B
LPPFNGFASEFVIYSGLFSSETMRIWAKLALAVVGAALAFVGAVSALSITRAFGVIFLGAARDDSLPEAREASRWMLAPMAIHALGTVLLGVLPIAGLALVAAPAALFVPGDGPEVLQAVAGNLSRIGWISGALAVVVIAALWLRAKLSPQKPDRNQTWGCGYEVPNTRMQYSGTSFSTDFAQSFRNVMVLLKRQKAPAGYFPSESYVVTDCVDAVERRLYNVIDHGVDTAAELSEKMREDDPRLAFAFGLASVVIIAVLVLLAEGALQ